MRRREVILIAKGVDGRNAHPIDRGGDVLTGERLRAAKDEQEIVLTDLHLIGGEREVVLAEAVAELDRGAHAIVDIGRHRPRTVRLHANADAMSALLIRVEIDAAAESDARIGRLAIRSFFEPAGIPVAEGKGALRRRPEVDEEAISVNLSEVRDREKVEPEIMPSEDVGTRLCALLFGAFRLDRLARRAALRGVLLTSKTTRER